MNPFHVDFVAFHNDPKVKEKYLDRVRAHRAADEIIKGKYWKNGKGCAIGCTIHSDSHAAYEKELGIPRILARLEDGIFENLPNGKAMVWPEAFLEATPVGVNLSLVWPKFAVWLLGDPKEGVIRFAKTERTKKSIRAIADAYQLVIEGKAESVDWRKLRAAAYAADDAAAACAAADDAAYAAADDAAYAAACAAADAAAAAYAAYAAADDAAAATTAKSKARVRQSEKLLELLSEAEGR